MPTNNPSVHYLGIVGFGALDGSHALCEAQWERIKGERADEFGPDGAYNHGLCDPHGIRMTGRGWNRDSAANGQQGGVDYNPGSRALCVLVGTDDPISTLCQQGIAQWASEAVEAHGKDWPLKGHSDFVATMCPGDHLRDFIAKFNAGTWKPPAPPAPVAAPIGDIVYSVVSGSTANGPLWQVWFDPTSGQQVKQMLGQGTAPLVSDALKIGTARAAAYNPDSGQFTAFVIDQGHMDNIPVFKP